jgi:hypothetical protein
MKRDCPPTPDNVSGRSAYQLTDLQTHLLLSKNRTAEIYRSDRSVKMQPFSILMLGEAALPGFALNLQTIFPDV